MNEYIHTFSPVSYTKNIDKYVDASCNLILDLIVHERNYLSLIWHIPQREPLQYILQF